MDSLFSDLRFALRQLARSPGFTLVAVMTLALGIGANTALYSVADGILYRARPGVQGADALRWVAAVSKERERPVGLSSTLAERLKGEVPSLAQVATIRDVALSMSTRGEPVVVKGQGVSGEYFAMLRVPIAFGRSLSTSDDVGEGVHPVAVLNYQTWLSAFGGDSAIVGRSIVLNGLPFNVIGVAERGFNGAEHDAETRALWVPATMVTSLIPSWRAMLDDPHGSSFRVLGRLRDVREQRAFEASLVRLSSVVTAADSLYPAGWRLQSFDASAGMPAGGTKMIIPLATIAIGVTGLILLICCANVSNLMLARALGRQREISTRLSIGASRARVVRQLLTESMLLALLGSMSGLVLAAWGSPVLLATAFPLHLELPVDWRIFAISAALTLGAALLFGLAPALHATRRDVSTALRDGGTAGGMHRSRLQSALVVAQVALSLMLLTMSGLFLRALDKARRIDVGFDTSSHVLALTYDMGLQRYDSVRAAAFTAQLLDRARSLPGVDRVALTDLLPLTESSSALVSAEGGTAANSERPNENGDAARATVAAVDSGYFGTITTPVVLGRNFSAADRAGALRVAVVSERFARERFSGEANALGSRIRIAGDSTWWTVVGIARDAVVQTLQSPAMGAVYLPLSQHPASSLTLLVRSAGASATPLAPALRRAVRELDPTLPIRRSTTLDVLRDDATSEQRSGATILAGFGVLALVLAALGLHGVLLFLVRQRTREIGIRMALGASRNGVIVLIVRHGLQLTAIGVTIGILLALGATQITRSLLFGISPTDAWTFAGAAALFVGVAAVTSWLPARRAARVDPVMAIRAE